MVKANNFFVGMGHEKVSWIMGLIAFLSAPSAHLSGFMPSQQGGIGLGSGPAEDCGKKRLERNGKDRPK